MDWNDYTLLEVHLLLPVPRLSQALSLAPPVPRPSQALSNAPRKPCPTPQGLRGAWDSVVSFLTVASEAETLHGADAADAASA